VSKLRTRSWHNVHIVLEPGPLASHVLSLRCGLAVASVWP
jgi:hypothetical protein